MMPPLSRHRRLQREKSFLSSEVRVFLRIVIPFCTPPSLIQSQARAGRARNTDIPRASSSAGPAGPLMSSPPLHSNDSDSSSEEEEEEEEENLGSDHDLPTIQVDQERCKAWFASIRSGASVPAPIPGLLTYKIPTRPAFYTGTSNRTLQREALERKSAAAKHVGCKITTFFKATPLDPPSLHAILHNPGTPSVAAASGSSAPDSDVAPMATDVAHATTPATTVPVAAAAATGPSPALPAAAAAAVATAPMAAAAAAPSRDKDHPLPPFPLPLLCPLPPSPARPSAGARSRGPPLSLPHLPQPLHRPPPPRLLQSVRQQSVRQHPPPHRLLLYHTCALGGLKRPTRMEAPHVINSRWCTVTRTSTQLCVVSPRAWR